MRRVEWEKLLKTHVLPQIGETAEAVTVHGGFVVFGQVGWTARVIWWSQAGRDPRVMKVAAGVVEMPNGTPVRPMLWLELGDAIHSGGQHWFDIPEADDGEGQATVMGQIAGFIRTQGIPYLERYTTLAEVQNGLRGRARELAAVDGLDYHALEQSGYLYLAAGEVGPGRAALEEADRQLEPFADPNYPDHIRANIASVLGVLDEQGIDALRRFLAERAIAKAKEMRLPRPVFDPPVAGVE